MEIVLCLILGYCLGCLQPAALLGWLKKVDLKKTGTKNLGATNTMLTLGTLSGAIVMLADITKSYIACKLAKVLFPLLSTAGLLAGFAAIVGHCYPFYLSFDGGKGLAAFAGLVLAYDPWIFLILAVIAIAAILIVNYGVAMPVSAGVLFPVLSWLKSRSIIIMAASAVSSILLLVKHRTNIRKALNRDEIKVREYIKEHFLHIKS